MKNSLFILLVAIFALTACKSDTPKTNSTTKKHIFHLSDTIYYVSLKDTIPVSENLSIHEKLHFDLLQIYPNISENLLGPTFARYPNYESSDSIVVEYGFFTSQKIAVRMNTESSFLPISDYAYILFKGEYYKVDKNIQLLNNIIQENNYIPTSAYFEIYYIGPHNMPNASDQWETEIRIPVKIKE